MKRQIINIKINKVVIKEADKCSGSFPAGTLEKLEKDFIRSAFSEAPLKKGSSS